MDKALQINKASRKKSRKPLIFFLLLAAGLAALWFVPPTDIDSLIVSEVAARNPAPLVETPLKPVYLICSIDDDPEDYNAHGIYNPTDLAVTVNNLKRLGASHLFLGTHLHWPDLDEFDNNTLRTQLETLDSCLLSVPLRRTSAGIKLPAYLADSAIDLSSVTGNVESLPIVNNLSLAPTISIPKNAQVGFSQLENEPANASIPLLARWGDKILLSSLLLERIHQLNGSISELQIQLGKVITIESVNLNIPIDEFGYFKPAHFVKKTTPHIISSNITNVEKSPISTTKAILTASGDIADSYRAIDKPASQLQLLSAPLLPAIEPIQLLHSALIVGAFALLLTAGIRFPAVAYFLWSLLLLGSVIFGNLYLIETHNNYLPITPFLIILLLGLVVFWITKRRLFRAVKVVVNNTTDTVPITVPIVSDIQQPKQSRQPSTKKTAPNNRTKNSKKQRRKKGSKASKKNKK